MLLALVLVPLASLMWGITNHIDKHLISKISKNGDMKGLIVFSSLVAGIILFPISLIITKCNVGIDILTSIIMFFSATFFLLGTALYFKALNKNDASLVTSMFQLIPVFGYFLGLIFLQESLTLKQIIGGLIVIISSIAITFEFDNKKFDKDKITALLFMGGSSLAYAIYFLLFRITTIDNDFVVMTFWYQMGLAINGILLIIFFKSFRKSFIEMAKDNGKKVFGFNVINEVLNLVANMLVNFAITLAPIALVLTLNGLQPFFVFLIGLIGTLILPKIFNEKIAKKDIIQKVVCITISIIGLAILYM